MFGPLVPRLLYIPDYSVNSIPLLQLAIKTTNDYAIVIFVDNTYMIAIIIYIEYYYKYILLRQLGN